IALESGDIPEAAVAFEEALGALNISAEDKARQNRAGPALSARRAEEDLSRARQTMQTKWELPAQIHDPATPLRLLQQLQELLAADGRLATFSPRAQQLTWELDNPLSIALVGEFNAGKSTLLNAIIGEEVAPVGILPTTAHTCFVR